MSEERLVPKLRFNGFDDNFISARLSDVCEVKGRIGFRGYTKSDLVGENEGALTLGGKHIDSNDKLNLNDPDYLSWEKYEESPEIKVHTGDIILAQRGTLGQSALIDKEIGKATINPSMVLLKDFKINNVFLHYLLTTSKLKKEVIRKSSSTAVPMISQAEIKKLKIYYPNQTEQEKIANFFRIIDKKIRLLENKLKSYQNFKKYLMQQIFTQKLRFNFEDEWVKYNLGDISTIGKGFTPSTSNPKFWDGDINWLSIADMNQGKYITETAKKITEEGCKNKKIVEKDTLIMSFKLTIGKLGILKQDMFTNEAICNFKWKINGILTEYMYYYLSSINILKYGSQAAKGITLNNDTLSTIPVLMPSIEEQQKIVDILSNTDIKIQFIQDNIEDVKKFKKGLLQQMFV